MVSRQEPPVFNKFLQDIPFKYSLPKTPHHFQTFQKKVTTINLNDQKLQKDMNLLKMSTSYRTMESLE